MKKLFQLLGFALLLLIAVLAYKTLTFPSKQISVAPAEAIKLSKGFENRLKDAIKIPTISRLTTIDTAAFEAFNLFLDSQFVLIDTTLEKTVVNKYSRYYYWPGRNPMLKPILLMGHHDVVPVEPEALDKWTVEPYSGATKDGYIWGRGALDDKLCVIGLLEAIELLLKRDYQPERGIYLAFGHDEEVSGTGASSIAAQLEDKGVELEYVLDEGFFIVENVLPGISSPIAIIGLAEKGYLTLDLSVTHDGGHSSMPKKQTAVGIISKAITALEANPFPGTIEGATKELFEYAGPEMSFPFNVVMANLWLFQAPLKGILSSKSTTNATIRTTTAATIIDGGLQDNIIPTQASATINFRLKPGDTIEEVIQYVKETINDERIEIQARSNKRNASKLSDSDAFGFKIIQSTIMETFPESIVTPGLVVGGTDSRYFESLADNVYRFLPTYLRNGDVERIHGIDERILVEDYKNLIIFYTRLIKNSTN